MLKYVINSDRTVGVFLKDQLLDPSRAHGVVYPDGIEIFIQDHDLFSEVMKMPMLSLQGNNIKSLRVFYPYHLHKVFRDFLLNSIEVRPSHNFAIRFFFAFNIIQWIYPWSIERYFQVFQDNLESVLPDYIQEYTWAPIDLVAINDNFPPVFEITVLNTDLIAEVSPPDWRNPYTDHVKEATGSNVIQQLITSIEQANTDTYIQLSTQTKERSLIIPFDFPIEVKTACQQYLLYFAQFLRDLGVDVKVGITEQSEQTLFSVTPKDQNEALEYIQIALSTYLKLPSTPFTSSDSPTELALMSQIYHLKGQVANAFATIQQQQLSIHHQRKLIQTKETRLQELELEKLLMPIEWHASSEPKPLSSETKSPADDREAIIPGIVEVKRLDILGAVEIQLPEILRRLKSLFRKNNS